MDQERFLGDWEKSDFTGVSLAHVLVKALEEKGVSYDIQDYVDSIYINGIDGESAGDYNTGSSWTYRVNGELVNKGIQSIYLSDGDTVEGILCTIWNRNSIC